MTIQLYHYLCHYLTRWRCLAFETSSFPMLVTQSFSTVERFLFNYTDINEQIFTQNKAKHKVRSSLPPHHQPFFPIKIHIWIPRCWIFILSMSTVQNYTYILIEQLMPCRWLCDCDVFDVAYYTWLSNYGHLVPTKSMQFFNSTGQC